jgi:hypothetical protein
MDWLTHTRRVVRCSPTCAAATLALAVLVVVRVAERPLPLGLHVALYAMVVISGVAGLHDPGRNLVHALPVSAAHRLLHRLVVIVPILALALVAVRWSAAELFPLSAPSPGWAALAALGAVGVGLCTVLTRTIQARAAEVTVSAMLAWVVAGLTLSSGDAPRWVALPWWQWPVLVGGAAAVVALVATTSGPRA